MVKRKSAPPALVPPAARERNNENQQGERPARRLAPAVLAEIPRVPEAVPRAARRAAEVAQEAEARQAADAREAADAGQGAQAGRNQQERGNVDANFLQAIEAVVARLLPLVPRPAEPIVVEVPAAVVRAPPAAGAMVAPRVVPAARAITAAGAAPVPAAGAIAAVAAAPVPAARAGAALVPAIGPGAAAALHEARAALDEANAVDQLGNDDNRNDAGNYNNRNDAGNNNNRNDAGNFNNRNDAGNNNNRNDAGNNNNRNGAGNYNNRQPNRNNGNDHYEEMARLRRLLRNSQDSNRRLQEKVNEQYFYIRQIERRLDNKENNGGQRGGQGYNNRHNNRPY